MRAVVSIGTNSTRLLIAQRSTAPGDGTRARWLTVRQLRRGTRLGEGLGSEGRLRPEAVSRTLDAAGAFAGIARAAGAEVRAIATSAMRRAWNAGEVIGAFAQQTGIRLEVLSGELEARYSYAGALAGHGEGIAPGARVGVLDAGGGSTELAIGTAAELERTRSFEIGAVRLTESTPLHLDPPPAEALALARERARAAFEEMATLGAGVERLILVGGTATTCAAILTHGERSGEAVDGAPITREQITALADRLASLTLAQRREISGLPAQRADIIVGGLVVLEQALVALALGAAIVSVHDLLLGYVVAGWR